MKNIRHLLLFSTLKSNSRYFSLVVQSFPTLVLKVELETGVALTIDFLYLIVSKKSEGCP